MAKAAEAKRSENQTYFIIKVENSYGTQFLSYNPYANTFGTTDNEQEAVQFNQEERATEVAQFFEKTAAMRSVEATYHLFKKSIDFTEIPLPKVEWLKDHKVEVEEGDEKDRGEVEIEE